MSVVLLHSDSSGYPDYDNVPKKAVITDRAINYMVYVRSNDAIASVAPTTKCGIYPKTVNISDGVATVDFYVKYNSYNTGDINNNYTARVYGVKLYDLIP
jgi:hypothetical protein